MKTTELNKIEGLNLPTELPCLDVLITRLERHLAEQRSIQSRLAADDPHYTRSVAEYKTKIAIIEQTLEQLRTPNFQFEPEEKFDQSNPSDLSDLSDLSAPQSDSDSAKNDSPSQNSALSESSIEHQQHPAESERSSTESGQSSAESHQSFAESDSLGGARASHTSALPSQALVRASAKSLSFSDRVYAERKLDADDLKELSTFFEEYKNPRSPLDKLAPEIQFAIIELMSERPAWMVAELLGQPAPIGLDIKTNDSSLNKFRIRHKERVLKLKRKERLKEIEIIAHGNRGDMFHSAIHLMEGRLIKTLATDTSSTDDLQRISRSLATLRRQALAERRPVQPLSAGLPTNTETKKPEPDYEL